MFLCLTSIAIRPIATKGLAAETVDIPLEENGDLLLPDPKINKFRAIYVGVNCKSTFNLNTYYPQPFFCEQ
jgi:hypothetical protein